ncbi:MAG: type II toxin-antitoxin system HicB family antitoxin [Dehalococcoidia bacterium]|nr:MAG: type II toxin-antitoxin system HicB family antitoxin [Dehalococcoidia bacterium]
MQLQRTVHAIIRPGEQSGYVAECPELNAVTQGTTLDDVAANLREVIALALEGDDELGLGQSAPAMVILTSDSIIDKI